jgi:hypothetical protein
MAVVNPCFLNSSLAYIPEMDKMYTQKCFLLLSWSIHIKKCSLLFLWNNKHTLKLGGKIHHELSCHLESHASQTDSSCKFRVWAVSEGGMLYYVEQILQNIYLHVCRVGIKHTALTLNCINMLPYLLLLQMNVKLKSICAIFIIGYMVLLYPFCHPSLGNLLHCSDTMGWRVSIACVTRVSWFITKGMWNM